MGFFKSILEDQKRKNTCCANCTYYNPKTHTCKKDLSYRYEQEPYEPCDCPKFDKSIW